MAEPETLSRRLFLSIYMAVFNNWDDSVPSTSAAIRPFVSKQIY